MKERKTFLIECTLREDCIDELKEHLLKMQYLGNIGSSEKLEFFCDGDGAFRPKFKFIERANERNVSRIIVDDADGYTGQYRLICENCTGTVNSDFKFCPHCGLKLKEEIKGERL